MLDEQSGCFDEYFAVLIENKTSVGELFHWVHLVSALGKIRRILKIILFCSKYGMEMWLYL